LKKGERGAAFQCKKDYNRNVNYLRSLVGQGRADIGKRGDRKRRITKESKRGWGEWGGGNKCRGGDSISRCLYVSPFQRERGSYKGRRSSFLSRGRREAKKGAGSISQARKTPFTNVQFLKRVRGETAEGEA